LALLLLCAVNFSIMWSPLPPLALSFILRFLRLKPSTLILLASPAPPAVLLIFAPPLLFFFLARFSWFFLFSISMASRSGERNLNHWRAWGSSPTWVKAYYQWGRPKCMIISLK
jgi:uncharacterized membrane protein YesL